MDQLSIFSQADAVFEQAVEALRGLRFGRARAELKRAAQIDPFMANLETWRKTALFLEKGFSEDRMSECLAEKWNGLPDEVRSNRMLPAESKLTECEIAKIAQRHLDPSAGFLDRGHTVHWGDLLFADGQYQQAQKILMQDLSEEHAGHAGLWASYANALWRLGRHSEALGALVRSLVLDPFRVDLYRIEIAECSGLYEKIALKYNPDESRALLLFFGWIHGVWTIQCPKESENRIESDVRGLIAKTTDSGTVGRYRRFCLYFYLDRISGTGDFNLEARENMKQLEPDLFNLYLQKIEQNQNRLDL